MIHLRRDKTTGKSYGYCYICYEDQRSTVLAVDNFNGITLVGRLIKVDHCEEYRVPPSAKISQEQKDILINGVGPGSKHFIDHSRSSQLKEKDKSELSKIFD